MDIFGGKGTIGVGAAYAAFLLIRGLLNHLVRTGALKEADRNAIVDRALTEVPTMSNPNFDQTRHLLNEIKK